jgi:inosose dehydratase
VGGGRIYPGLSEEDSERHWNLLLEGVHEFGRIANSHGVRLGFHPHDHTRVFKRAEIVRVLRDTDPELVGITFDTAHIAAAGMDVLEAWAEFSSRVVHVHLKDFKDGTFTDLEGHLPLGQYLRLLASGGYGGWVTIELDAASDPEASARKAWTQVLQWLA